MGSNDILVKEYLESLKEDKELDYLFPILLKLMGFNIVSTAVESKGQSQYGKDIIAIGRDDEGTKKRFYFELKGHADKDINQTSLFKRDGILESIREAKFTNFSDASIPGFNNLPIQIVVVHNGILKSDTRASFEGLINQEFPNGGFERWDIYKLTDLFGQYLFGEYLFTDSETVRLFKRTLVLLDAPDYDFSDFKQAVHLQIQKIHDVRSRAFKKFFASMNLLSVLIIHYSKENNNLAPARDCVTFLVLKVWGWILQNNLETKSSVLKEFRKLLTLHFELLDEYFIKTRDAVTTENGLFSDAGKMFESVGYPLRAHDYLGYLHYYFYARMYYPSFNGVPSAVKEKILTDKQMEYLITFVNNNDGCLRPLLDNHSIPMMQSVLFFLRYADLIPEYKGHISNYLEQTLNNIIIIHGTRNRFPELYNNVSALTEYVATSKRPKSYIDSSSLLITYIFEIIGLLNDEKLYNTFREHFDGKIDLQMALCKLPAEDLERLLFEKRIYNEMHVSTGIRLPEDFSLFKKNMAGIRSPEMIYRTDEVGFPFLRHLAHVYYSNEFLPDEWRKFFNENTELVSNHDSKRPLSTE